MSDARHALRSLLKNRGFSIVVLLTLALGIGANTAIFSLLDVVVLRPLAVPAAEELVRVYDEGPSPDGARAGVASADIYSWPLIQQFERALPPGATLAAMTPPAQLNARIGSDPSNTRVLGQLVSGNFFSTFRTTPAIGRLLTAEDSRHVGAHPVAVLGYGFWQRRFGGDSSIVGRTLPINDVAFTIVGVANADFRGIWADSTVQVWVPLVMQHAIAYRQNAHTASTNPDDPWPPNSRVSWLNVAVRSRPEQRTAIESGLARLYVADMRERVAADAEIKDALERRLHTESFARGYSTLRGQYSSALFVLMALVALVLLTTCANIATLRLAQWAARQREFAIRLSLGASRLQLVRQLLLESLALSLAGGVLALLFADWASTSIAAAASAREVLPPRVALDGRVLGFCALVSVTTSLAFAVIPALRVTSARPADSLKTAGAARHAAAAMRPFVAAQVALSVVLVGAAALFAQSLLNLWNLDPGFDREHTAQIRIEPLAGGVPERELQAVYRQTTARARQVPGVIAAEVARLGLASGARAVGSIALEGYEPAPGENVRFLANSVGPTYFSTTGMRVLQGRTFTERDVEGQPGVAVINEIGARRYFGGVSQAIGKRIDMGMEFDFEIVGVVADARVNGLREAPAPMAFYPLAQAGWVAQALELRVTGDPAQIGETVRRIVNAEEPRLLANSRAVTIGEQLDRGVSTDRLVASLAASFGVAALLLACVGLYGVLTYAIERRMPEIGVRMALGATPASVIGLVVGEGLRVTVIGVIVGVTLAVAAGQTIESVLFGVSTSDPFTYAIVIATLLSVAFVASLLPARRAARVEPMTALRAE